MILRLLRWPGTARYEVHAPKQDAFGDWTAILVGDEYYRFGDFDPAEAQEIESDARGAQMKIARFRSRDLGQTFEFVGSFGRGHPDPTIGFAEGRFFLITQTGQDYSSFGPWVRGVSARVGSDNDGDGKIDDWTGWQTLSERCTLVPGFRRIVSVGPATLDLGGFPKSHGVVFEIKLSIDQETDLFPEIDEITISFE